jgi:magnesium-transporting ATPase (P-type)
MHATPPSLSENPRDVPLQPKVEPLTAENVLWSNTVLAAGSAVGFVIYTGAETRAVMNTSHPGTKVGLLDLEINRLAKVCILTCGSLNLTTFLDSLRRYVRPVYSPGCAKWISWAVVHIRVPIFNLVFVHYSYQVNSVYFFS